MPRPDFSQLDTRWWLGAGCAVGMLLLLFGWWLLGRDDTRTGESPSKTSAASQPSRETDPSGIPRSRMIVDASTPVPTLPPGRNAATFYRQAFALANKLTRREKAILQTKPPPDPPPTEAEIAALLQKIDPIIALLRQGSTLPDCDWGISRPSFDASMSFMSMAQRLAQIALWDSNQRLADEPDEAVQNLQAIDALSNSMRLGLVGGLTNGTIHQWSDDFLAQYAASLSPEGRQALLGLQNNSEIYQALWEAMQSEGIMVKNSLDDWQNGHHADGSPLSDSDKEVLLSEIGNGPAAFQKQRLAMQNLIEAWPASLYWTDAAFNTWIGNVETTVSDSIRKDTLPVYVKIREIIRQTLIRNAMTAAGLSVLNNNPAALQNYLDPFTN